MKPVYDTIRATGCRMEGKPQYMDKCTTRLFILRILVYKEEEDDPRVGGLWRNAPR
jgi:hypothetical protein